MIMTEEKIKKIRKQLSGGVPQGELESELINEGYTDEDIRKAFATYSRGKGFWYLTILAGVILIGIWYLLSRLL